MSGIGGFVPMSNNPIRPTVIQPGGEPPRNAPVPNEPPQGAPVGNVGNDAATKELIRSLDVLLSRAGKAAGQAVDDAAIAKLAKGAKFDKATVEALRTTAKAANEAMRILDTFTGLDFATAIVRGKQDEAGQLVWDKDNYVGKAVEDALDKQMALSNALSNLLNNMPAKATAAQQAALEEAMLQCDRRVSEVETVILEMAEIAEKCADNGMDKKTQERIDRKVTDLAGEKALEMHDRTLALQTFQDQLAPVVQRLNHFAANPEEAVPKNELTSLRLSIGEAKNAIANAANNGSIQIRKADGGTRELFVDRSFLDEAAKLLGEAESKLGKLRENAARDLRRRFVMNDAALPSVPLLQPKFVAKLRTLGATDEEKRQVAVVADLVEALGKYRKAMLAYAENPSGSNRKAALNALDNFRDDDLTAEWKSGLDFLMNTGRTDQAKQDPELHAALQQFTAKFCVGSEMKSLVRNLETLIWNTEVPVKHLETLNARAKSSDQLQGADAVRAVFFGEGSFTTLVESRVHGYADGDIDPALDDRNVTDSRQLGSGGFNTVELVTFKDGTQRVFKPEFAGRMAAENTPILNGIDDSQQLTRINRAVNRTADALGLGDVMVKTTAGVHGGVFGMYMELAPGMEGRKLAKSANPRYDNAGNKTALGTNEIRNLPPEQFRLVRGRMMRQFNRLHWFDAITGQGDRHNDNYMVQVRPDLTVVVKAIDNDASFGVTRTGLTKFRLSGGSVKYYEDQVRNLSIAYGTKSKTAQDQVLKGDPGFKRNRDGSIEVDVSLAKSPITVAALYESAAFHQVTVPDEMDRDLYNKLQGLKAGPERDTLLKDWADRFGARSQQYRNAVARLDEAIAAADRLEREGKVYGAEDWEKEEVQNRILNAKPPLDPTTPIMGQAPKNHQGQKLVDDYKYMMSGNLYARDFANWK